MLRRTHDQRIRQKDEDFGRVVQDRADDRAELAAANRKLAEADAANKRLSGSLKELRRRLDAAHDNQLGDATDTIRLEARVERLKKVAARLHSALQAARADQANPATSTADQQAIKAWERRVKAHEQWFPPADLDKRPIGGGTSRPTHPATELRRMSERCLALEARLAVAEGRTRKGVGA
jgi:DNA repair exonuclease SbcCD ATPase subunit